jgi:anti-anti-sigma factor
MPLKERKVGAVHVLRLEGPLRGEEAVPFRDRLVQSVNASLGRCVVDGAAIPYVDSRGLEVLAEAGDELAQTGQSLKLCGLNETVRQVLELTELAPRFEFFADVNAAVRSFL